MISAGSYFVGAYRALSLLQAIPFSVMLYVTLKAELSCTFSCTGFANESLKIELAMRPQGQYGFPLGSVFKGLHAPRELLFIASPFN